MSIITILMDHEEKMELRSYAYYCLWILEAPTAVAAEDFLP